MKSKKLKTTTVVRVTVEHDADVKTSSIMKAIREDTWEMSVGRNSLRDPETDKSKIHKIKVS